MQPVMFTTFIVHICHVDIHHGWVEHLDCLNALVVFNIVQGWDIFYISYSESREGHQ